MKKFPLLKPLMIFFISPRLLVTLPKLIKLNAQEVKNRIARRGKIQHLDYFQQICPDNGDVPTDERHFVHLEQVAGQLLMAGFDPISNVFYSTLFLLLKEPKMHEILKQEIRDSFSSYGDITPEALLPLRFLHTCILETMRLPHERLIRLPP